MRKYTRTALAAALLAGTAVGAAQAADSAAAQALVTSTCAACHGPDGNSPVPNFPRLAGLDASYLLKQLEDFRAKRRASEIMAPMAESLSPEDMANLAAYFAGQRPAAAAAREPALVEAGKKLYEDGNSNTGVPACYGCHGSDGAGSGRFPRLAGQHPDYLIDQLKRFAAAQRKNDKRLMQAVAARMTEAEMLAVVEYLAAQP